MPMRFQGDVKETGDHGTLTPERPDVHAADAWPVHDPVLLWDFRQCAICSIPLDGTHLHLLQALHHWFELKGAGPNDVQPLHNRDEVTAEVNYHRLLFSEFKRGRDSDGQVKRLKIHEELLAATFATTVQTLQFTLAFDEQVEADQLKLRHLLELNLAVKCKQHGEHF